MNLLTKPRFALHVLATCSFFALIGCATAPVEPKVQIVEVKVPVAVACVPKDFPPKPVYPDPLPALRAAPDLAEFNRLMTAGWGPRDARLKALEDQVAACR